MAGGGGGGDDEPAAGMSGDIEGEIGSSGQAVNTAEDGMLPGLTLASLTIPTAASSSSSSSSSSSKLPSTAATLPLKESGIRSLLGLLTSSIMEVAGTFQNAAFQLIRAIVDAHVIVPEVYDLMDKLTEQIPLSQRKGIREASASIVVTFITTYPLGEKRMTGFMKQMIANCSFAYEEGRSSAFAALAALVKLLPLDMLNDHALSIFLPLTLRLVHDPTPACRESAGDVIATLTRRVQPEIVGTCLQYAMKWLASGATSTEGASGAVPTSQARALVRTGSQVAGLLVMTRPDLFKRQGYVLQTVSVAHSLLVTLLGLHKGSGQGSHLEGKTGGASLSKRELSRYENEGQGDGGGAETWAVSYHLLVVLERMYMHLPAAIDHVVTHPSDGTMVSLMEVVQEAMLFPHAWVRSVACRLIRLYLSRREVTLGRSHTSSSSSSSSSRDKSTVEILTTSNGLFHLGRRLCVVLNQPHLTTTLLEAAVANVVFVVRAMARNPDLCVVPLRERAADTAGRAWFSHARTLSLIVHHIPS